MWECFLNKRVLFGNGKVSELPELLRQAGVKAPFIVTSPSQLAAVNTLLEKMSAIGQKPVVYSEIKKEPDLLMIDQGAQILTGLKCDGVVGIGGGSVLDAAKAIAMLATNPGRVEEFQMGEKTIDAPCLPMIMVPTTAGTGSEATKVSVVYNPNNGLKKSVYSPFMIPDTVILDPQLTVTLPARITASTGMDALSHAIESYVSLNATPMTEMLSIKAMELINSHFEQTIRNGNDLSARGGMLLASYLAGCALNAGIGIAHIIAQPFGGIYKLGHGDACSIFLPLSMEVNLESRLDKYCRIAEALGVVTSDRGYLEQARGGIARVREIQTRTGAPQTIGAVIDTKQIDLEKTVQIIQGATGHIKCNPRPVDAELLGKVLRQAM